MMTKGEAIDMCMEVRDYLTSGNPMWDKEEVGEALDMAIRALMAYYKAIYCPRCGRTFSEAEGNPWWIVYRELSGNRLLMGHYDARNGASEHFMYGIATVMEAIAVRCGMQEQWDNEFYANMAESEAKKYV